MSIQMLDRFKKQFWPVSITWPMGIQRVVLFCFGVVLLAAGALLVAVPIDLHALQQWQTLLAAVVALGAAFIAYAGAMAKVYLDRKLADERLERQKRGVYHRLLFALNELLARANFVVQTSGLSIPTDAETPDVRASDLAFVAAHDLPEIAEAWARLQLFSKEINFELVRLRTALRDLNEALLATEGKVIVPSKTVYKDLIMVVVTCEEIVSRLSAEVGYNPRDTVDKDIADTSVSN